MLEDFRHPGKKTPEQRLNIVEKDIQEKLCQLRKLLGNGPRPGVENDGGDGGELASCRRQINGVRERRQATRLEFQNVRSRIEDIRRRIKEKREEIADMECKDLYFKNSEELERQLKKMEDLYLQCRTAKEEGIYVIQIDRLKRNQRRLGRYNELVEERQQLVEKLHKEKAERQALYQSAMQMKKEEAEWRDKEKILCSIAVVLKAELESLQTTKNQLLQLRLSSNKACSSPVDGGGANSPVSFESYELFSEERRLCQSLLAYMQQFASASEAAQFRNGDTVFCRSVAHSVKCPSKGNRRNSIGEVSSIRRRSPRRDRHKPEHPIPHSREVFLMFAQLNMLPPLTYSEVSSCIEQLQRSLEFYESQVTMSVFDSSWFDESIKMVSPQSDCADSVWTSLCSASDAGDESLLSGPSSGFARMSIGSAEEANPAVHPDL